jgi:hypothetical protein
MFSYAKRYRIFACGSPLTFVPWRLRACDVVMCDGSARSVRILVLPCALYTLAQDDPSSVALSNESASESKGPPKYGTT